MEQDDIAKMTADQQVQWILAHPDVSTWLKDALRGAQQRDPLDVLNDLQLLDCVLRAWCETSLPSV